MNDKVDSKESQTSWPPVAFEALPWHRDPDELRLLSKTARRKIALTYQAAVPSAIASMSLAIPSELACQIEEVTAQLVRFDEQQSARGYNLPVLLVRSESAASSQIEHLTSNVRNVALAEMSDDAPQNARLVAQNIAAMRCALELSGELSIDSIVRIHHALMNTDETAAEDAEDAIRTEQVWIGGGAFSPHGALFVPPAPERVHACLDDLVAFARRDDLNTIVKISLFHAQFETIHPFVDGNGRTGRTLLHNMLRDEGVLRQAVLPVSAGLLHDVDEYMSAIPAYQDGNPYAIVEEVLRALEVAISVGQHVAEGIDDMLGSWRERMHERAGSSILRLPELLVEQPVVTRVYLAEQLHITPRAASNLVERACGYGILRPVDNRKRRAFYQADEIIATLEEISTTPGIRRMVSGRRGSV